MGLIKGLTVKKVHGFFFCLISYVDIWFHGLVVPVTCPFHYDIGGYAQHECVADKGLSAAMGSYQFVFGMNFVYPFCSLIICSAYRLVNLTGFAYFFDVFVHPLVDRHRQRVYSFYALVFLQYGFGIFVQFDF